MIKSWCQGSFILIGMKVEKSNKSQAHPRAFDIDEALEQALQMFGRKGYVEASLKELTEAMGINRPSRIGTKKRYSPLLDTFPA